MMKSFRLVLFAALLTVAATAFGQDIRVTVDGRIVGFSGQGPVSVSGRVLVPLRGVLEAMGAYVEYRAASRSVYARRGDTQIELTLGDRNAVVNGANIVLDVPAASIGGSTMVPLRFMGESLGAEVKWMPDTRTVAISTTTGGGSGGTGTGPISVTSFSHSLAGWMRGGETIDVILRGTPGLAATFSITGVVENIALREVSAGEYRGSWTAPTNREISITEAAVVGALRNGPDARLIQAATPISVDTIPPRVSQILPEANARIVRGDVSVSAVFEENGSGIDASSVKVLINGQDVTGDANVTPMFTSLRTNRVAVGRNVVAISAKDNAGNAINKTWEFIVTDATSIIKSLTHNATGAVQPGEVIVVRLEAAEGGTATFSVGQNANMPMTENPAGVYTGRYTVRRDENLANAAVTAKLIVGGQSFTIEAPNRIGGTTPTGTPPAPNVTTPTGGDVTSPIVVKGTTLANGTVKIRVRYRTKLFGAIPVTGTIYEDVVRANNSGSFESESITLSDPGGEDTTYEITVIAVGEAGKESSPKVITVRRR